MGSIGLIIKDNINIDRYMESGIRRNNIPPFHSAFLHWNTPFYTTPGGLLRPVKRDKMDNPLIMRKSEIIKDSRNIRDSKDEIMII